MKNALIIKKVCQQALFHMLPALILLLASLPPLQAGLPGDRVPMEKWIARAMDTLTLEQKVGQLFIQPIAADDQSQRVLKRLLSRYNVGGLILEKGTLEGHFRLIRQAQQWASTPLLIAMDAKRGLGSSLTDVSSFPSFTALGAIQNEAYLYDLGKEVAQQCRALGIHINIAPILLSSPGVRQNQGAARVFSEDQTRAFAKGLQYMQGMQDHGLIPCYEQLPLAPQLATVERGAVGNPTPTALQGRLVAQLSLIPQTSPIYDKSLLLHTDKPQANMYEKYLKLEGLVLSDPLTQHDDNAAQTAIDALQAGNDILVASADLESAMQGILAAMRQGSIQEKDIDRRVYKILRAKYKVGLDSPVAEEDTEAEDVLDQTASGILKQYLYEEAVTLVRNDKQLVPIKVLDAASFASLSINFEPDRKTSPFQQTLSRYAPFDHYRIDNDQKGFDYDQLYRRLSTYGHIIVGLYPVAGQNTLVNKEVLSFLNFLRKETAVTLISFAPPVSLSGLENFSSLLCAYDNDPVVQQVVPQVLFGAVAARGKLPLNGSPSFTAGTGIDTKPLARLGYALPETVGLRADTLAIIDSLAQWAIDEEATPGCQVLIARNGKVVFEKAYGYQTYDKKVPITPETIYDIASVTKVAATMQAVMFLQERGTIDIDEKVSYYLTELKNTDKENITVRELLLHRAGLRSFIPFWAMTRDDDKKLNKDLYSEQPAEQFGLQVSSSLYGSNSLRDSVWTWTVNSKLRRLRGRRNPSWKPLYNYRYSDLSFYMLHQLVERVTNQPMNHFLAQNFYDPLGLTTLTYQPLSRFSAERIAPTEEDKHFRNELVRGTVHDEGAALYGGVAGHAGLFSNAHDLAVLMQMNLQDGIYGGERYFLPGTVSRFSIRQYNDSRRGLGWDKPEYLRGGGPTAPEASYASYGHLGFTGTSVWVDPKYDLVYIFLSNRIHPSARNTKLLTEGVRTKIQSVVYRAMQDYSGR